MRTSLVLVSVLVALLSMCKCVGQDYHAAPSYKVLSKKQFPGNTLTFKISVDTWIWKHEDLAGLVCAFFERERPVDYDSIIIEVFFLLDRYVPEDENPVIINIHLAHSIGTYNWNRSKPASPYSLSISKDMNNRPLKGGAKFLPFDHLTDCDKYRQTRPR